MRTKIMAKIESIIDNKYAGTLSNVYYMKQQCKSNQSFSEKKTAS